ncbi:MlaD family protein [Piscinibacter sakaiensis]|uniref:MlaD family protein n=1 Tax=Piscinibacter sakaiensis TaxID=1547922 RepID=UPI003AAB7E02
MATDRFEDDAPPVANLDLKARLMFLLVLLLIGGVAAYVLYARGFFERTQTLVLIADNAQGVVVGMDLTFAGFPIGRVDKIELSEQGNARIVVEVPVDDARWLRTSSVFTMESGLVGAPKLRAYSGILTDPPLEDGAERKLLAGDAMAEVQRLMASIRDLVANLTALTRADSALGQTLEQLQATTARLNGPQGALGVLFGDEKGARQIATTLDNANRLMLRIDGLTQKADQLTGRLDAMAANADSQVFGRDGLVSDARATVAQLNALLGDARANLKKVDAILVDAQAVAGQTREATADLGKLRGEVEASLRKVERLVDEVNRKWPFKRETKIELP